MAAHAIEAKLDDLTSEVDVVLDCVRSVAQVPTHTQELHFRGDLRFLQGLPPDRPADGIKDCRIYEAVLAVAQADQSNKRGKYLVTKDSDFDFPVLVQELGQLGFEIRKDPGQLYGELRASSP